MVAMIICDVFDGEVTLGGPNDRILSWRYWTDLPAGTRVSLEISRRYMDHGGRQCLWTLHDEALVVGVAAHGDFNGGAGTLSVDDGDRVALQEFEESLTPHSAGIKTSPESTLWVSFIVGARQPLRAFGKDNANLDGGQVEVAGGVRIVRLMRAIECPLSTEASPFRDER
jgi:hypothetical protein